jgi:hypothetical protein
MARRSSAIDEWQTGRTPATSENQNANGYLGGLRFQAEERVAQAIARQEN